MLSNIKKLGEKPIKEIVEKPIGYVAPPHYPIPLGQGGSSIIKYDMVNQLITKKFTSFLEYDIYEREVYWLQYLNEKKYEWCPKLLDYNSQTKEICMEYVGESISKSNAPEDWKEQLLNILEDLKKENIFHNDIKDREVLVKDKKLYLIDYGRMSLGDDWSCQQGFREPPRCIPLIPDHHTIYRIYKHLQ